MPEYYTLHCNGSSPDYLLQDSSFPYFSTVALLFLVAFLISGVFCKSKD